MANVPPQGCVFILAGLSGVVTAEDLAEALGSELLLVPAGGTTGQVLTKTADGYAWQTLPG